jgi:hypothetical protein
MDHVQVAAQLRAQKATSTDPNYLEAQARYHDGLAGVPARPWDKPYADYLHSYHARHPAARMRDVKEAVSLLRWASHFFRNRIAQAIELVCDVAEKKA